ncbi:uncharacterized protein AMSG_02595 [Thecamonas trahens ATCC 50062]|uniref:Cytochrome b5 heme-binding domain-containing protein n=1 Tax=Thecamonas trahens ATCC 50062 TaxID=461836 RepID=A0A0L0D5W6_THETB|nr:hypothetical protein AMSG_02595 [Thecamonas trahens ATCC 50062]KNC47570.1 hypothetical protein AMSG_02595 [Thecamonas trahens ATCC 50062]|eukprot:XP_013759502.1 hypothetical protein AMSG_02595 [Thecamonas trahens ATCC 50062]
MGLVHEIAMTPQVLAALLLGGLVWLVVRAWVRSQTDSLAADGGSGEARSNKKLFLAAEVSKHASPEDLWMIVHGKVYDVTPYVDTHEGGDAILNNAGGDNTDGFHGPQHPSKAHEMLKEYYIGECLDADADGKAKAAVSISNAQLAAHGNDDDAWIAVNGFVFDVTGYMPNHPGGAAALAAWAGSDATDAFYGDQHPVDAVIELKKHFIGVLA